MDADGPKLPPHPTPTQLVVRRLWELRHRKGLSGAAVAQRMTELGVPWDRNTVAKLESGRRVSVNVDELLALAYVLGESPLALLLPGNPSRYFITPAVETTMADVYMWFIGDRELPTSSVSDPRYERQFARLAFRKALPWAGPPTEDGAALWASDPRQAAADELQRLVNDLRKSLSDLPVEQQLAALSQTLSPKNPSSPSDTDTDTPDQQK